MSPLLFGCIRSLFHEQLFGNLASCPQRLHSSSLLHLRDSKCCCPKSRVESCFYHINILPRTCCINLLRLLGFEAWNEFCTCWSEQACIASLSAVLVCFLLFLSKMLEPPSHWVPYIGFVSPGQTLSVVCVVDIRTKIKRTKSDFPLKRKNLPAQNNYTVTELGMYLETTEYEVLQIPPVGKAPGVKRMNPLQNLELNWWP